jgi:hypothetical protein
MWSKKVVSFVVNDGPTTLYFRALDKSWNISQAKSVSYSTNRIANFPDIITNNWNNLVTNSTSVKLNFELDNDLIYFLIGGKKVDSYTANSTSFSIDLPLVLGDNVFTFKTIDLLLNESPEKTITITKTPTPTEWSIWKDSTINFRGWVRTNSTNFQRLTPNGDPGEVFSR